MRGFPEPICKKEYYFTSSRLWLTRSPFLAAEVLIAMAVIFPSLN